MYMQGRSDAMLMAVFFWGQCSSVSRLNTLGALSHHTPLDLPELGHPYILPDHHGGYRNQ